MDADRIREIREAEAAATSGPWDYERSGDALYINRESMGITCAMYYHEQSEADAHFIALSRSAVPELLAMWEQHCDCVDKLEAERDQTRKQAERLAEALAALIISIDGYHWNALPEEVTEEVAAALAAYRSEQPRNAAGVSAGLIVKPGDRVAYVDRRYRARRHGDPMVVTRPARIDGGWMAVYEHDPEGYEYVLHPRQLRDGCYVRLRGESECGPRHSTFPGSGGAAEGQNLGGAGAA